jgi:CzcA family heavy metal efflux pump
MLRAVISLSLRYRWTVLVLASILCFGGMNKIRSATFDVFPEFATFQVDIQTEAPGFTPEQVELLVTRHIESAVRALPGIQSVQSTSAQGLSVVTLVFDSASDLYRDRQLAAERLSTVRSELPDNLIPKISPLTSSAGDLMSIGLTSRSVPLDGLRQFVDYTLIPKLLAVKGVAKVGVFGGHVSQIQICVDPKRLTKYDLSLDDVYIAAKKIVGIQGTGFVDTEHNRIEVTIDTPFASPEAIARSALVRVGGDLPVSITIGDVADVHMGISPVISAATIMGEPGIVLNVWSQFGSNTIDTTSDIDVQLGQLAPLFKAKGITVWPSLFRAKTFIERSLLNLENALTLGAFLVVMVLFLFLASWRMVVICCAAIPFSLICAALTLQYFGITLNILTIGGLAIALGEVVDDAVISVENIARRLRVTQNADENETSSQIILRATLEVRSAVIFGTLAVAMVFIPVVALRGLAGKLLVPLGISYLVAIGFSLLVALTLTPAMCRLLLRPAKEPATARFARRSYQAILRLLERVPLLAFAITVCTLCLAAYFARSLEFGFLPDFRENHFLVHLVAEPGINPDESVRIGNQATAKLKKLPWLASVAQRVGRAESDDTFGPNESELEIELKKEAPHNAESVIRAALSEIPGVSLEINTFLAERIEETMSGAAAPVVVHVTGDDLKAIETAASAVSGTLTGIPGAVDIATDVSGAEPSLSIAPRNDALLKWGFEPTEVQNAVSAAIQGLHIGQTYQENVSTEIALYLGNPGDKADAKTRLNAVSLRSPSGVHIPLPELVHMREIGERTAINHLNGQRTLTVTCDVEGRELSAFVAEVQSRLNSLRKTHSDVSITVTGTLEEQNRAHRSLLISSAGAAVLTLLILAAGLGEVSNLLLIVLNLPISLAGGIFAVVLAKQVVSLGCLVGFITAFGITLRNSIMLMSHYRKLVLEDGHQWNAEASIEGASDRLLPILMTALVTGFGLLPLALHVESAGHEIEGPMALVILGGLISSTIFNLLILPVLAPHFATFGESSGRSAARRSKRRVYRLFPQGIATAFSMRGLFWAALVGLTLVAIASFPLVDPSEARYATISQHMVLSGRWLIPEIDRGQGFIPFWGKPPLHFWLVALSMKLFRFSEFAARLPSFLNLLAILFFCTRFARYRLSPDAAKALPLIFWTSPLFLLITLSCLTDSTLTLCNTAALVSFALHASSPARRAWGYLFFAALAAGFLTKGPVALALAGIVVGGWTVLQKDRQPLKSLPWLSGILLAIIIAAPWFVLTELRSPGMLRYFFVNENLQRLFSHDYIDLYGSSHRTFRGVILPYALLGAIPWGFVFLSKKMVRTALPESTGRWFSYLLLWAIAPVLIFLPSNNVLATYVVPGLPGLILLTAQAYAIEQQKLRQMFNKCYPFILAAPVIIGLMTTAVAGSGALLHTSCWAVGLIIVCGVSLQSRRLLLRGMLLASAAVLTAAYTLNLLAPNWTEAISTRRFVHTLSREDKESSLAFLNKLPYSALFYLQSDSVSRPHLPISVELGTPTPGDLVVRRKKVKNLPPREKSLLESGSGTLQWAIIDTDEDMDDADEKAQETSFQAKRNSYSLFDRALRLFH